MKRKPIAPGTDVKKDDHPDYLDWKKKPVKEAEKKWEGFFKKKEQSLYYRDYSQKL